MFKSNQIKSNQCPALVSILYVVIAINYIARLWSVHSKPWSFFDLDFIYHEMFRIWMLSNMNVHHLNIIFHEMFRIWMLSTTNVHHLDVIFCECSWSGCEHYVSTPYLVIQTNFIVWLCHDKSWLFKNKWDFKLTNRSMV